MRFPIPSPLASRRKRDRCDGFALLITITLLAFLVLLLVSLASLTRVETQVAGNNQQLAQARQNALMALQVAVGQLQRYAGPDQRVTARADIDNALVNTTTANGRWTGVYGNRATADYEDEPSEISAGIMNAYAAAGTDALAAKGSQGILLSWLVSGSEKNAGFDPLTAVGSKGQITLTTPPAQLVTPGDTVNLAAMSAAPSFTDASTLLVGPGSATTASDHVSAPLVKIEVPEGLLPGFASASATARSIGRYAWWIGDEGTKARINLPSASAAQAPVAFVTAQRAGVELIDGVNATGSAPAFNIADLLANNGTYDPASVSIANLLDAAQLPMLSAAHATALGNARKHRFHDLTAASQSVLSDAYAGGLKKDLSALLATAPTGSSPPADMQALYAPSPGAPNSPAYHIPTWGKLRSFARTSVAAGAPLEPRLPSQTDVGVAPVMTHAEVGLEYYLGPADEVRLAVFPRVVLWNPYTSPIKAARYEFGLASGRGSGAEGTQFRLESKRPADTAWSIREERRLFWGLNTSAPTITPNFVRFIIDVQADIPPGESHIFTLSGTPAVYDAPYGSKPQNVLTQGLNAGFAYISTGYTASAGEHFRVYGFVKGFRGGVSAYLGQDPDIANSAYSTSPDLASWPPAYGATPPPWYQASTPAYAGGSVEFRYDLQGDEDGVELLPTPGVGKWGTALQYLFTLRTRHLVHNNVRANSYEYSSSYRPTHGTAINSLFDSSPDGRASSALDLDVPGDGVPENNILFEFRPADQPLLSIGQLQHANLAFYPSRSGGSYLIGTSSAHQFAKNRTWLHHEVSENDITDFYDGPYLLNRMLWDRYFVSTVPHAGTAAAGVTAIPAPLPNTRHIRQPSATDPDLLDADKAAANLLLSGGFNINSTSEQAWRAILGGNNGLSYRADGTNDPSLGSAFSRFSNPAAAIPQVSGRVDWAFTGYRRLTEAQIAALASGIVTEVRNRGPFVSLADFVNRRLKDNPGGIAAPAQFNGDESLKGALQNAIDNTAAGTTSINRADVPPFTITGNIGVGANFDAAALYGGPGSANTDRKPPFGSSSAYAAQFLTQADVLSTIGPGLTARSDTFTIRTYGDVTNPVTGDITGRAWCEAVVQRVVEPVHRKNSSPASSNYNEPAAATAVQPDFGRRFVITSFRWLSSSDI